MKKIAIFADGWKKYVNYAWVAGSRQYIEDHNLDVNLYVFSCFGNYSPDEKYNQGEYNIFNLPDLTDFDGIMIELTNVSDNNVRDQIIENVMKSGVPTVSLLEDVPGLYYAGTDNYDAMYKMVEHMIVEHGCRKLNYIGGPQANFENRERYRAYCAALKAHGIPHDEHRAFFQDFEIDTGVAAFKHFYEKNMMPDAFICANDNIAVGVCHAADQMGLHAPGDFKVTGYDNFDKASFFQPRITTVDFSREDVAYLAMSFFERLWAGEKVERTALVPSTHIFQESCGCPERNKNNRGKYITEHILAEDQERKIANEMLLLKRELTNCISFREMAACIPKHLVKLSYDEIYIVINKEIADCYERPQLDVDEDTYPIVGYPDEMEVLLASLHEFVLDIKTRGVGELIPGGEINSAGDMYLFAPLHFRDREVGYIVLKNCDYLMSSQMLFEAVNVLQETMENLYHRIILHRMNQELSNLYIRDSLTGLYNRMAYQKLAAPLFEECQKKDEPLCIMFVDLDHLKYINDTFGHDMGNIAIRAIASTIQESIPEEGIAMRYGGDEFVVLIPDCSEAQAKEMVDALNAEIVLLQEKHQTEFVIEASVGYVVSTEKKGFSMNEFINLADERMYENKKARRANK